MKKEDKITLDDIIEIGQLAKDLYNISVELAVKMSNCFGKSSKNHLLKYSETIYNLSDKIKNEGEEYFWKKIDGKFTNACDVFYGQTKPIKKEN